MQNLFAQLNWALYIYNVVNYNILLL
jgi:hypothetical protein